MARTVEEIREEMHRTVWGIVYQNAWPWQRREMEKLLEEFRMAVALEDAEQTAVAKATKG